MSAIALDVPDTDGFFRPHAHSFALEDRYGPTIEATDGEVLFRVDLRKGKDAVRICELVCAWVAAAEKCRAAEISTDEYDKWRYYYPQYDDKRITAKVPSQELSSGMINKFFEGSLQ